MPRTKPAPEKPAPGPDPKSGLPASGVGAGNDEPRRWRKAVASPRILLGAIGALLLAGAATASLITRTPDSSSEYRIVVHSNPDELVTKPQLQKRVGNFVTAKRIELVSPPPGGQDTCTGRYMWAHTAD